MLYFITSNQQKIRRIQPQLTELGIETEIKKLDLQEIQSHNIEEIAIHKARDAFEKIQAPLFVVDDGWFITALNGFPGAYMKSINQWFTPEDFLSLMKGKKNREVFMQQVICYIDEKGHQTFTEKFRGEVLYVAKSGENPWNQVLCMTGDGLSIGEAQDKKLRIIEDTHLWSRFAEWLTIRQRGNITHSGYSRLD